MNFLPGWSRSVSNVAAPLASIAFLTSATSTGTTITAPATVQAGDLLVLLDAASTAVGPIPTAVTPTNFTLITNTTVESNVRLICSLKIAVGGDASSSITGMADTVKKILLVFRPNTPLTGAVAFDVAQQGTDGNPAAQICNASTETPPLVVFGVYYGHEAAVATRSMTPAKTGEVSNTTAVWIAYLVYNTAPADVTIDMIDESLARNILQSFGIRVS